MPNARSPFTLVDLLVVIGIIDLLFDCGVSDGAPVIGCV
jgi:hypothetical protein